MATSPPVSKSSHSSLALNVIASDSEVSQPHSESEATQPISQSTAESSPPIDGSSGCSSQRLLEELPRQDRGCITINILPDEALLDIFDHYVHEETWETLVHVSRRWRQLVFGAPRRLNLQLVCTSGTPVREKLDIWPALPIIIRVGVVRRERMGNVMAALEKTDRVCGISVNNLHTLEILASKALKKSFPALTHLDVQAYNTSDDTRVLITPRPLPNSFLGGSAPRLRSFRLHNVGFPALPKLLLSAKGIVRLYLEDIPYNGYIPPECLRLMSGLEVLHIKYERHSPLPDQESRHQLPPTRTLFPVLTVFAFKGNLQYLIHFFAHIDAPLLKTVDFLFEDLAIFDVSQISMLIGRIETLEAFDQAYMFFGRFRYNVVVRIILSSSRTGTTEGEVLMLSIESYNDLIWQLRCLSQSRGPFSFKSFAAVNGYEDDKHGFFGPPEWAASMKTTQWLEPLRLFTAVENLYLSENLAVYIAPALAKLRREQAAETLPALRNVFIAGTEPSGQVQEAIGKFVAAKQRCNQPVAVQCWHWDSE